MKHNERIAPVAAAVGALSAISCCLPLGITAAAGAAGLGAVIEPLRPWLMGLSIVFLSIGLRQLYQAQSSCQRRSRASQLIFLLSAIVVVTAILFPQALASALADLADPVRR